MEHCQSTDRRTGNLTVLGTSAGSTAGGWRSTKSGLEGILLGLLIRGSVGEDIQVVLLEESKILTGLRELTLLHTLTDVPVDEGALGVHEAELGNETLLEDAADGDVVSDHADVTWRVGHVVGLDSLGGLVVKTDLEPGGAPLDERDLVLALHELGGLVGVAGANVTTVVQGDGHVLILLNVEVGVLDKEGRGLEHRVGDGGGIDLLVSLVALGHARGQTGGHEVETGERNQVGLELVKVDVQLSIESQGSGHGGDGLGDQLVDVLVGRAGDSQALLADVVASLVVNDHRDLGEVQQVVGGQEGVVGLDNGRGDLRAWVDLITDLGLLAEVNGEALEDKDSESRAGSSTNGVVDDESLEVLRVLDLLADRVVRLSQHLLWRAPRWPLWHPGQQRQVPREQWQAC